MRTAKAAACALLTAGMFQVATAAEADVAHWSVGVSGGTLGISPEIGFRFNKALGLRANGGFFDYDRTEEVDDIEYDGTLKLKSIGVMADVYPFGGSFRVSAGLRSNKNRIDLVTDDATVEIDGQTYTQAQFGTLRGGVDFKKTSPAVTLGWGGKFNRGFTMGVEAGVMMQGSPNFTLTSEGGAQSNDPAFQQRLENERADAEEDAEDFKLWPILQLHLKYRF
jgi:hypothetical protein